MTEIYNDLNCKEIRITRVPGQPVSVFVTPEMTVRQALTASGLTLSREEVVYAGGSKVSMDANVNGYSLLVITANIKGN